MGNDAPMTLVTTKPDAEVAEEFKDRIRAKLEELLAIMNEARAHDFVVQFGLGLSQDPRPRPVLQFLRLEKHF
jgi:hypothetical protein